MKAVKYIHDHSTGLQLGRGSISVHVEHYLLFFMIQTCPRENKPCPSLCLCIMNSKRHGIKRWVTYSTQTAQPAQPAQTTYILLAGKMKILVRTTSVISSALPASLRFSDWVLQNNMKILRWFPGTRTYLCNPATGISYVSSLIYQSTHSQYGTIPAGTSTRVSAVTTYVLQTWTLAYKRVLLLVQN